MPEPKEDLTEFWSAVRVEDPNPLPEREMARRHPGDLVIGTGPDRVLVRIGTDGTITYGSEYTPDEAAVTFWTAMAVKRLETEERLLNIQVEERLLALLAEADIAYETAQSKARSEGATPHDKMMEEISQRAFESLVSQVLSFARGMLATRPDLKSHPREGHPVASPPTPGGLGNSIEEPVVSSPGVLPRDRTSSAR